MLAADTEPVKVFAGERMARKTNVETADGFTATYEIPVGADVVIQTNSDSVIGSTNGKTYVIGNTKVTNTNAGTDTITFTMTEALTLNIAANDGHYQDDKGANIPTVTAVTSHGGVTGTFYLDADYSNKTNGVALEAGKTIYVTGNGKLDIDSLGTGNTVIKAKAQAVSGATGGTDYWDSSSKMVAVAAGTNVDLYSANKVIVAGTNVTSKGTMDTADDVTAPATATSGTWVPVGVTMTVSGGDFDGYVIASDANTKHATSSTTTYTTDDGDVWVYGAYKLTLGTGVEATYGSGSTEKAIDTAGTYMIDSATTPTMAASDSDNKVVVKVTDNLMWYAAPIAGDATQTMEKGGTEYQAFTKVTLKKGSSTKQIDELYWVSTATAAKTTVTSGSDTDDVIVGVNTTNTLAVIGSANGTVHFEFTDGATVTENTNGSATAKPSAAFTIGDKAVEISLVDN